MKKRNILSIAAAALIVLLAGCPAEPKRNTVNEQLMPFFKVEDGRIVVVKGASFTSLNVPDTMVDPNTGNSVTEFGGFEDENDKANLKDVSIADGVESIGDGAFKNADNLTSVKFEDNSKLTNIGDGSFENTSIDSLNVPSSVDNIGSNAFANTQIKDLTIPEGVSSIGSGAFNNAPVENLTVPTDYTDRIEDLFGKDGQIKDTLSNLTVTPSTTGNKNIADNAFNGFGNLGNVTIADGVESIGNSAFEGASSLGSINFPSSVETIGDSAFKGAGDADYKLPYTVTDVGANAFDPDDRVSVEYAIYNNDKNGDPVTTVWADVYPTSNPDKFAEDLKNALAQIKPNEHDEFDSITDGVKTEGSTNGEYDEIIDGMKPSLPSSSNTDPSKQDYTNSLIITWIDGNLQYTDIDGEGAGTDDHSVGLKPNVNPDSVNLNNSYRGNPVTEIADNGFNKDVIVNIPEGNKIDTVGSGAFQNNSKVTEDILAKLPNVTVVGDHAFSNTGMTEATIPSGLKEIPEGMFEGSKNLATLNPSSEGDGPLANIESIGADAFKDTALKMDDPLKNNDKIASVGEGAFQNTDIGPKVTIPSSVDELGTNSFAGLDNLKEVVIEDNADLTADEIAKAFGSELGGNENVEKLTIPANLVDTEEEINALKEAFPNLKEIVVTPSDDVVAEPSGSLSVFPDLNKAELPADILFDGILDGTQVSDLSVVKGGSNTDKATTIPEGTFNNLDSLTNVVIGDGITIIGKTPRDEGSSSADSGAFAGCDNLVSVTLPSTIDDIGDGTFEDCGKLTTIKQTDSDGNEIQNPEYTVPEGTENIGENAFKGTPLDKVSVPSGIQSIGDGAFAVVDENGDLAAGKHPGINITIPGNAIGENQGLDDIFLPAGAKDEDRPVFFESVTITGTGSGNSFDTSKLTGTDDSTTAEPDKGVDVVIGNITIDESYDEIKGDFSNVGVVGPENGGDGNLHITLPENGNVAITGPFSNGPKVVDENGNIIPGDDNLGGLFFESEGIVPSTSTGSITIGEGAFKKDETTGKSPAFPNNSVKDPFSNNEYGSPTDTIPADEVVISNVTSIGKDAFKGNENVERITIPADCTSIGADAFAGCTNLKEIIFEGPRTAPLVIEDGAFAGCTSLNKISTVVKDGYSYTYTEGKEGVFDFTMMENMVESIGDNAFNITYTDGTKPSNVKLPSTLDKISNSAFSEDVPFEYTVSVDNFKGWNGTTGTAENVTFTGKFGEDGGISANAPKDVNINGNGYKPSWSIGSSSATISGGTASFDGLSVSELVSNKGGEVSWNISSGKVTIDGEEVTVEVGKSWNDYSKYFDSSTGGRYAIGTEPNVAENELIDLDSDITGDDIGKTISKYYEVTVVGTGTKEWIKVDSDIASTVTGKPGKYFASTNGSLSGQITLSDSLQKVGEAHVYIYEYVTLTFDAYDTSYGNIGGKKTASYNYIKGSNNVKAADVTTIGSYKFASWSPTFTATAEKDGTYQAYYSYTGTVANWPAEKTIYVGINPETGKEYTISDCLGGATPGANAGYGFNLGAGPLTDISSSLDASTKDLIAKANSFKIYNNVQFSGEEASDLKLISGYYDKDGTITIVAVPAGYDYKLNGEALTTGQNIKVNVSTLAGNVTVSKTPWTFTYVFKTSPSKDPDKNPTTSSGPVDGLGLSVNGEGGDYGTRDEIKFTATYGTATAELSYYKAAAIGMVTVAADTYHTIEVDGKRLTVEFDYWSTDPEGKHPVDIESYNPEVTANGITLQTLYAQWRPLRIVITDFAKDIGGTGMSGLTYITPEDSTMIREQTGYNPAKYTPYLREGDNLNISGSSGNYTVTIYASDINSPFLKFTSDYDGNLENKTYTYDELVALNWVMQGKTQQSRYFPVPTDNGGITLAQAGVYLTVKDLKHN